MRVEIKEIQRLTITGVTGLDPVTVYLEDASRHAEMPSTGKVTITCHQDSWTATWSAMSKRSVAEFFCSSATDYLVDKLGRRHEIQPKTFSGHALVRMARQVIVDCRRGRTALHEIDELGRDEARALFDAIGEANIESLDECWQNHALLRQIFGDEWFLVVDRAIGDNPNYRYLFKVVSQIQAALQEASLAA